MMHVMHLCVVHMCERCEAFETHQLTQLAEDPSKLHDCVLNVAQGLCAARQVRVLWGRERQLLLLACRLHEGGLAGRSTATGVEGCPPAKRPLPSAARALTTRPREEGHCLGVCAGGEELTPLSVVLDIVRSKSQDVLELL
jgi:hypothetical protein